MRAATKHVFEQGPVIASMFRTGMMALRQQQKGGAAPTTPGPVLTATVPPRSPTLINDYIRHVGGSPSWYRGVVPPHLYPQWGFPLMARTLETVPYDLLKVLNGGASMEIKHPIPAGEKLHLKAWLHEIDDDGRRALINQRLVTGTDSVPEALVCNMYAFVPLGGGGGDDKKKKKKKERPRVPVDAREVGRWSLGPKAGLDFALLTGDFNPVHWVRPYAKAAGFRSTILHGYATLARAVETLNRTVFAQDPSLLTSIDVRFTKPLVLPAKVGVYVDGGDISVGTAPGGPAFLTGRFTTKEPRSE